MKSNKPINLKSLFVFNVIAMGLIVVLAVSHYFLTSSLIRSELFNVKVLHITGQQRMLSQQLTREALLLLQSGQELEREGYLRGIEEMKRNWLATHKAIEKGSGLGGPSPLVDPELAGTYHQVDQSFHQLVGILENIIAFSGNAAGLSSRAATERAQTLRAELIAQSDDFVTRMDRAVNRMGAAAVQEMESLKWHLSFTWGAVLTLVFLATLYLLLPVATRLKRTQSDLTTTVDRLQDTLERDQAALTRSEQFKSTIFANSSEGIVTMDDQGRTIEVNKAVENIFGYSSEEAIGRTVAELFIPHEMREKHAAGVKRFLETGEGPLVGKKFETPALHKDGHGIHVEMVVDGHVYQGRHYFTAFMRDVTLRKSGEVSLMRLSKALEQVEESIIITDPGGYIEYVNAAFERNTGYTREEVVGRNPDLLVGRGGNPAKYREIWQTISAGSTWFGTLHAKTKDGSVIEEEASISPILGENGEIINYIAVKRDMTEERSKEAQLRQAQKMEAIGVLSGGIAHDFNNILTPILGFTEIAKKSLPEDSKVQSHLDAIFRGAMRAKDLVRQILLFGRQANSESSPLQLTSLVKEVVKLLRSVLPTTIEIKAQFDPDLPPVIADATQIHTLLMNLCTNASHAMPEGGVLSVELKRMALTNHVMHDGESISGDFIRLSVADTGHGMDDATKERIFDPFFTTKESGKGTGLGLSMVYGVAKNHQGYIAVRSAPGEGATFEIYLPVPLPMEKSESEAVPSVVPEADSQGRERVLFIDDEEEIVSSMLFGLRSYGYRVTAFCNPEKALEHLRLFPENFDVVVTDRTMPNMTGEKLAREVRQLAPHLPVLLCTGNSEGLSPEVLQGHGIDLVVNKPYSTPEMCQAIRTVMNKKYGQDLAGGDFPCRSGVGQGCEPNSTNRKEMAS